MYTTNVFYREYEQERAGFPVDFSAFVAEFIARKEKTKKYTITKTRTIGSLK